MICDSLSYTDQLPHTSFSQETRRNPKCIQFHLQREERDDKLRHREAPYFLLIGKRSRIH